MIKKLAMLAAVALGLTLTACGSSSTPKRAPFPRPANTVAVNFSADDRDNKSYMAGQLRWKGGLWVDPTTRLMSYDSSWSGKIGGATPTDTTPYLGWPLLYDDGPWTDGGHEPEGAVAGDHIWGTTAFVPLPPTGGSCEPVVGSPQNDCVTFEYGLIDNTFADLVNGGGDAWVWHATPPATGNGRVSVFHTDSVTGSSDHDAAGLVFAKFTGTYDVKVVLDTNVLDTCQVWDMTKPLQFKGTSTSWADMIPTCASGVCTFVLSTSLAGPHFGLVKSGATTEFVWDWKGAATPKNEYKCSGNAAHAGVTAFYKLATATTWTAATITDVPGFGGTNTAFVIP
jgi:hypothetical protein